MFAAVLPTYRHFNAQTRVELGWRGEVIPVCHLFLDELAVSFGVTFGKIVQHGPKLVDLLQNILCTVGGGHLKVTVLELVLASAS